MTSYLIGLAVLLLILAWFFWPRSDAPEPTARPRADIGSTELEQAEREVQEAPAEDSVRDWGPGAPQPPIG